MNQSPSADIVIRTMQDDLAGVPLSQATLQAPLQSAPVRAGQFPLPTAQKTVPEKIVVTPAKQKRGIGKKMMWGGAGILFAGGIAAAGWYGWNMYTASSPVADTANSKGTVSAAHILPKNASLILSYHFEQETDRTSIRAAWQKTAPLTVSPITALSNGDPRAVLDIPAIHELYIVLLSDNVRPYIVFPEDAALNQKIVDNGQIQALHRNGWVIINLLRTDLYSESLAAGNLVDSPEAFVTARDKGGAVRLLLQPSALAALRQETPFKNIPLAVESARFAGQFTAQGLLLSGIATQRQGVESSLSLLDQRLLNTVPGDVQFAHFGNNFFAALQGMEKTNLINVSVTSEPANRQLLSQLTSSYAYYIREGEDRMQDTGLIIQFSPALSATLAVGNPTTEQALLALIPLITGQNINTPLAFADANYQNVPLRYVNLGNTARALDYTIQDNNLLIATSKEGLFALIDTLHAATPSFQAGEPWQALLAASGSLPQATNLTFISLKAPVILQVLPHAAAKNSIPISFSLQASPASTKAQVTFLLQ